MPSPSISSRITAGSELPENTLDDAKKQPYQSAQVRDSAESPMAHRSPSANSRSARAQTLRKALSDNDIKATASNSEDVIPLDSHINKINEFESLYSAVVQELEKKTDVLSSSLELAQSDFQALKQLQSERAKGAKARAVEREGTINSLKDQNTQLKEEIASLNENISQCDAVIKNLEARLSNNEIVLNMRDDNLKKKSDFLASSKKIIDNMKDQFRSLKEAHRAEIETKDREILELQNANAGTLATLQDELKSTQLEKLQLQRQVDALTAASNQFTPAKSNALSTTTKKIADEAQTLKQLNTTLLSKLKDANEKNATNMNEIKNLKAALENLCKLTGIDPEKLK